MKNVPAAYEAEIITASLEGLQAFVDKLKAVRAAHPEARQKGVKEMARIKLNMGSAFPHFPIHSGSYDSVIGSFLGPLNRTVIPARIHTYLYDMTYGEWWFTPDPIVVTDEGAIINGQHRLLAAERALSEGLDDAKAPRFVVVWGVDKRAAILMDEARRTASDRHDIALRFARSA